MDIVILAGGQGRRFGVRIRYCREDKPLGTGGRWLRRLAGLVAFLL